MTPKTVAQQAALCTEFCRQEYWSGLPFRSPWIFLPQGPNPGLLHCGQIPYLLSSHGSLCIFTGVLLYFCSQSFSRFGLLLLLLLFRKFSLFWLIVRLPSVPSRWYKAMKQTWWQFLGIAGDCDFTSNKKKKGTFPAPCLDVHWNSIPAWFLQLSTSAHFPSLSS